MRILAIFGVLICSVACAAPVQKLDTSAPSPQALSLTTIAANLRDRSCPEDVSFTRADSLPISVAAVDRGPRSAYRDRLDGVTFAGAWHLQAENPAFGGLSGLAVLRSGSLLAVSDAGAFVQIGIDPETQAPDGLGSLSFMPDANGKLLSGKQLADSEGLTLYDGMALVSFEHSHRIEAFDLESCGAAARAATVSTLPGRIEGRKIGLNRGAEALRLKDGQLQVGYEHRIDGHALVGTVLTGGALDIVERRLPNSSYLLTGSDYDPDKDIAAYVYRWYLPGMGTRIVVEVEGPDLRRKFTIASPMPVDNFEGIALADTASGGTRIWLISDDNFNPEQQRTLLFAFDI